MQLIEKSKPCLLILGGSHSDIPIIKAAKSLGFYVITTGNRKSDLGHAYSDHYVPADYSDADEIHEIARNYSVSSICPCCNDFAAISASEVATRLGLPGHDRPEIARIIHHKDRWREFANHHLIPSPRAFGISDIEELKWLSDSFEFPLLVKPVDLTGGKGIETVNSYVQAELAIKRALEVSKEKRVVIEEYIEGTKHGFSAFLRNQTVAFWFVDNEQYHISPYLVAGASTPSLVSAESVGILINICELVARILGLVDGIFHVQFIERCPGDPIIIEICRRPPGDLYVELVRYASGAPYSEWIIESFSGYNLDHIVQMPARKAISRHCLMADKAGILTGYEYRGLNNIRLLDGMVWGLPGDEIYDPAIQKLGILLLDYSLASEEERRAISMQQIFHCRVT